jgi:hypothetical protein
MWEPRRLTIIWASAACYRESFTFVIFYLATSFIFLNRTDGVAQTPVLEVQMTAVLSDVSDVSHSVMTGEGVLSLNKPQPFLFYSSVFHVDYLLTYFLSF